MSGSDALAEIASRLGIATQYTDALGERREVTPASLQALIAALGLPPDPAAARRALREREAASPLGPPPAHILHAEDPQPVLPLRLAAKGGKVRWSCRLEGGGERHGRAETTDGVLPLPARLPLGYHRLELAAGGRSAHSTLIVAPPTCHLPAALGPGRRAWGLTCQLYGLRSARNIGIGDFTELGALARRAGEYGAAALALNPMPALFAAEPLHVSPYSPSSRRWLDHRYIDIAAVPGFAEDEAVRRLLASPAFAARRAAATTGDLIDYGAVAACQRPVLEALYRRFRAHELEGAAAGRLGREFREFQRDGGQALADFACFEALHEQYRREGRAFSWRDWPPPLRDPRSAEVARFAAAHRERLEFFEFLQFEADRQLAAAAAAGRAGGLSVGLYRDLAVGANPHGAEAWVDQALVAPGASIGAPPDGLNFAGQNWGLAPVNPLVLREQGFAPFIAALRANMRHAGLLRIDHGMSINRLFWVPAGMPATAGSYVDYPFDALLRLVALESRRQRCAVIGEDLGTLPEGFRSRMQRARILSYRVARFERDAAGGYKRPAQYPVLAAATAAIHDIATIKGHWLGVDLEWRRRLGLYTNVATDAVEDAQARDWDRKALLEALAEEGLLARERFGEFLNDDGAPVYTAELGELILAFVARARSRLMLAQIEDVIGETEEANLPGTNEEHPNWRRRLSQPLEEILDGAALRRVAARIAAERRRGPGG